MRKLHLLDALLELAIQTLSKSYLPRSEGHLRVPAPIRGSQPIGGSRLREGKTQFGSIETLRVWIAETGEMRRATWRDYSLWRNHLGNRLRQPSS
jgi:hypothetical protein